MVDSLSDTSPAAAVFAGLGQVSLDQLEFNAQSKTWHSLGEAPRFLIAANLQPGVVQFRLEMSGSTRGRGYLCFDTGQGFLDADRLLLPEIRDELSIDTTIQLEKPVRQVCFSPLDKAGSFSIKHFSLEPISATSLYLRAIQTKIKEIKSNNRTGRAFKKGMGLLLKGDLRSFRRKLFQSLGGGLDSREQDYQFWRETNKITEARRDEIRRAIRELQNPPLISIVTPVYNVPEQYLRLAIESVLKQLYPHWELCLADDCSTATHVRPLLDEYAKRDKRIKVVFREKNGHISAASNSALELATGEYMALLDNDDELPEHALFKVARAICADRTLDWIYSDEDKIDVNGVHKEPFFKPDWSPEYLLSCMYTCHLTTYRMSLVRELGGFRSAYDTSQDYDLALRISARKPRVHHIPDILYHWRTLPTSAASGSAAKPKAHIVAQKALESYVQTIGRKGSVEDGTSVGFHRVRFEITGNPKVSIVIPAAAQRVLSGIESIRRKSTWKNFEILVVGNNEMPNELQRAISNLGVTLVQSKDPSNHAAKLNLGAEKTTGEHIVFMSDDIEIVTPEWMEAMLEFSQQDDIGVVGCKQYFPDGRLQYVGVNALGNPGNLSYAPEAWRTDYFYSTEVHRNFSAVNGAVMMTRAEVFKTAGAFGLNFPLNYSDVDYCLKVIGLGKRVVYTPYARHLRHESVDQIGAGRPEELEEFKRCWGKKYPSDPYYNPNLSAQSCDYRINPDHIVE